MTYNMPLQGQAGPGLNSGDFLIIANNAAGTGFSRLFNTEGATILRFLNTTPAWLYAFAEESAGGFGAGSPIAILPPSSFSEQPIFTSTRQVAIVFNPLYSGQPPGTAFVLNNAANVFAEAVKEKAGGLPVQAQSI